MINVKSVDDAINYIKAKKEELEYWEKDIDNLNALSDINDGVTCEFSYGEIVLKTQLRIEDDVYGNLLNQLKKQVSECKDEIIEASEYIINY